MKKVAFISRGHAGSLFPLIKRFLDDGFAVDYYCLTSEKRLSLEASDLIYETTKYSINEVPSSKYPLLSSYFGSDDIHIFIHRTYRPFESYEFGYNVALLFRNRQISQFCKYINNQNYAFINVVGRYNLRDLVSYCKLIKGNLAVSLHEVINHKNPNYKCPSPLIRYLIKSDTPIIVHSEKSYNDLIKYRNINKDNVRIIPFGKFETYCKLVDHSGLKLPHRYILFIGHIDSYKGLDLFYSTTSKFRDFGVRYVVAGAGNSEHLALMKEDSRYLVINKFLSVYEFADLIKNANFIVCPYKSGSQSGISVSSYVFNVPLIASNLQSFKEIIEDNEDGLLFNVGDETELEAKLFDALSHPEIISKLRHNLESFEIRHPIYNWDKIFCSYKSIFSNM